VVLLLGLVLTGIGVYALIQKATWLQPDDGVFWERGPGGVVAGRIAPEGPGARAGIHEGDVLLGIDGEDVRAPDEVESRLARHQSGEQLRYSLLRLEERSALEVVVEPPPRGNVPLFYYLSLIGFFSLIVGTIVMLRRPTARAALHFYAICVLFFLRFAVSYSGELSALDWTLLWVDTLAGLLLPVVFLHFCLVFPEPRGPVTLRSWLVPAAYLPAFALAGAAAATQLLYIAGSAPRVMWNIATRLDRLEPLYFAIVFALSFGILLAGYRRERRALARKQFKWLVWGTGIGVGPFLALYALPFAFGLQPGRGLELVASLPLGLVPLTLAYAVVKHRLMDVELIFRRSLVYTLATAATVGACMLFVAAFDRLLPQEDVHSTIIAVLCAVVVILLFARVKTRIQDVVDRLIYRERYHSRKALLRLSQGLNSELDLGRVTESLIEGVGAALGVRTIAVFLPEADGTFATFRARGALREDRLPAEAAAYLRAAGSAPVAPEALPGGAELALDLAWLFPCPVRDEVIAVLGVGRPAEAEPLNSEEMDLLQALAAQAATAFMNGRLYRRLLEKADELQRLKDYNESILEGIDSGIVVVDLEGRIEHWNRAMELLLGRGRRQVLGETLDAVFPHAFLESLRGSLVFGRDEEIAHLYKLHLPTGDGRSIRVNVSVAPFVADPGRRSGSILIVEDVTARVRLEEQLQHSEKMASIGLLAAGVAHEVNTPLAGISSYTQMALARLDGEGPVVELLSRIEKQSFRAAKIVNNLLNFSRSGGVELTSIDLNRVILDVLALLEHQFDGSRIKIRRELAESLPRIQGDENRLQQVFFNLMLNARDAMSTGGWLTLTTRVEDDEVIAEVSDTGCGIRREDIRRIYDPFFTTKGIGRGTGLGLSVSFGILQEHGGRISVDSTPGQGTSFRVSLPFEGVAEAVARR
jgi:PAS domain S-box-containing protein